MKRQIGTPSRLLLLLPLCSTLCFCFQPAQALASDTELSVDEQAKSELPDNFFEVMESRTSSDQFVVIENDKAILRSAPTGAKVSGGDVVSTAAEWYMDLIKDELTTAGATDAIIHDLAWRYYEYPSKQAKIPITLKSGGWIENKFYTLQQCTSYGDWCAKNKFHQDAWYSSSQYFNLLELNHQSRTWNSASAGAETKYADWYYYYEGMPSSGGGTSITSLGSYDRSTGSVTFVSTNNNLRVTGVKYNNTTVNLYNNEAYTNVGGSPYALTMHGTMLYTIPDDSLYADKSIFVGWESNGGNIWAYDSSSIEPVFTTDNGIEKLTGLKNISGSTTTIYNVQIQSRFVEIESTGDTGQVSVSINLKQENSPGILNPSYSHNISAGSVYGINNMTFVAFEGGGGSGGGSNEPVPSPGPTPKPQPQQPIITTVNSPTYNNVTYQTINQTDVDLQPVIDALAVHDENMQDAWNAYSILFDDWMDTLKTVIESWEQVWLDWTNTLYQDLQYYLDQIQYVLYEILMALQTEPYVPVPEPETVTINFDNAVNQLSTRFPFSIPWDVKLLMELLEQPRQAPEFDLPVVMTEYTVHIDFSPFENMAAVSRFMSLILFTGGLLMATKKMIGF